MKKIQKCCQVHGQVIKMKKFEKILRKHIEAATPDVAPNTGRRNPNPCLVGERPDREKICTAVSALRASPGNYSGSNQCARQIQNNNRKDCTGRRFLRFANAKVACTKYQDSVQAAMPAGSTQNQIDEARKKAMCDCLNFIRYGTPANLSGNTTISDGLGSTIEANQFKVDLAAAYNDGCNYLHLGEICDEMKKADEFARTIGCF